MEIRHPVHPEHMIMFDTTDMRDHFLVDQLFTPGEPKLVYSFFDRLIIGGVCPIDSLTLEVDPVIIGASYLLERRELCAINIGGKGTIIADGTQYEIDYLDCLYVGKGVKSLEFKSDAPDTPAKYYILSAPAHTSFPTVKIRQADTEPVVLGEDKTSNHRTLRKYVHPDALQTCQLVAGITTLEPGSVWNTMPVHTHQRRMEAYCYFDMKEDDVVFHLMGEPTETRHLVVRSEEAVISPSWSIHSGTGTANYSFIWGMAGENQDFGDMDHIPMTTLK